MKIKELLAYGRDNLIEKEEPYRLSKILLKHVMKVDDSYFVVHENDEVEEEIEQEFRDGIKQLNEGQPLQYITHYQEFMKLDFYVDENVLIPQPDTEILAEEIINTHKNGDTGPGFMPAQGVGADDPVRPVPQRNTTILDLCTGSGAIGIALAHNLSNAKVTLTDVSKEALAIAKKNAIQNGVERQCTFIESDMFQNITGEYDVIVSNPPYIKTDVIPTLDREVQNEPTLALDGGTDGIDFYKIIADESHKYLKPNGTLALEIGYDQKEDVIKLLENTGRYTNIQCIQDLAGNNRVVICNK